DRGISKYLRLEDEHNPRLAATVFEFQRLEASNRAAAAVCPCGPMARATDPNTTLRVSGIRARRRRFCGSIWQQRAHPRDMDTARANGRFRRDFAAHLASGKIGSPSN